ncbi:MAG: Uma2 family endonuclease [Pyrinomonadaceae bacterium]
MTTLQRSTASELFEMPHDGFRYELVKGELRRMSPTGWEHGEVVINISLLLGNYVKANKVGFCGGAETGFKIASDPDTVRAPDLSFVSRERRPEGDARKKFFSGAPDLAVEVLSPGDTRREVKEKVEDWLGAGTRAVWIVDPGRRTVKVYRSGAEVMHLSEGDELDGGEVVPGFRCRVAEIFV